MAGDGTLATTMIITKGLSCAPCSASPCGGSPSSGGDHKTGIITSAFSLYCTLTPPTPTPTKPQGGGGGIYPRPAWNKFGPGEIQDFYKPVPLEQQPYLVPRDQEAKYFQRNKKVTIHLKVSEWFDSEKIYMVPEHRARTILKIFNFLNVTRRSVGVVVSNVRRVTTEAVVRIKNFRRRG